MRLLLDLAVNDSQVDIFQINKAKYTACIRHNKKSTYARYRITGGTNMNKELSMEARQLFMPSKGKLKRCLMHLSGNNVKVVGGKVCIVNRGANIGPH